MDPRLRARSSRTSRRGASSEYGRSAAPTAPAVPPPPRPEVRPCRSLRAGVPIPSPRPTPRPTLRRGEGGGGPERRRGAGDGAGPPAGGGIRRLGALRAKTGPRDRGGVGEVQRGPWGSSKGGGEGPGVSGVPESRGLST